MKLHNFLQGSYTLETLNYSCERTINWYPDMSELGDAKESEPIMLSPTPGLTLQHTLPRSPIRGIYRTANNFIYCVAGNGLFLLTPTVSSGNITWSHTLLAYLTTSTGYVSICDGIPNYYQGISNTGLINQVIVVDGSTTGLVFQEGTSKVVQIGPASGYYGSSFVTFQDGLFIFSQPGTITGFYASDPLNINDLDTIEVNLVSDNVSRIISDHDVIWILGTRYLSVWQNSGGGTTTNTFQQIPGATAPTGTVAPWTVAQAAGMLLWVTNDDRGWAEVGMALDYRPIRVSNHAVELWLQNLQDVSQTIAWTYQEQGHTYYCLNNPSAISTWCFDVAHKIWHERAYFSDGNYSRDLVNFHMNVYIPGAFPNAYMHLCGDYQNGNLYSLDNTNFTHNGQVIRRERTTPHQSGQFKRLIYSQIQVDAETGIGLDGAGLSVQNGVSIIPTTITANNVLLQGNGPNYTLVALDGSIQTPISSISISPVSSYNTTWSNSYSINNNQVSINPTTLTQTIPVTLGNGNGTNTVFQIPNIVGNILNPTVYLNDWRGNNIQPIYPSMITNLCASSYNFNISWSLSNVTATPGVWSVPDDTTNGTYLYESSANSTHYMSIPYVSVTGNSATFSIYSNNTGTSGRYLQLIANSSSAAAVFDTVNGVVTASQNCNAIISLISTGIYQCSISYTSSSINDTAYVALSNSNSALTLQTYTGTTTYFISVWGAQITATSSVQPLIETNGTTLSSYVTITPSTGTVVFNIAPLGSTTNVNTGLITQVASIITATYSVYAPQLLPTEYQASYTYQEYLPTYTTIGTDPQLILSYSKDGGHVFSSERPVSIGKLGDRYKRMIWRKLGMCRDMVFKVTCEDPIDIHLIGAEIQVKPVERGV